MKHFGNTFECEQERDEDFMRAYRSQISNCSMICLADVFNNVVNMPSKRFWVSEERASIVIASMFRGNDLSTMRETKREMFNEIHRRVLLLKKEFPNMTMVDVVSEVVNQPAPKFYLTPSSARVIYYRIRKKYFKRHSHRVLSNL